MLALYFRLTGDELGLLSAGDEWYLGSPDSTTVPSDPACTKARTDASATISLTDCSGKAEAVSLQNIILQGLSSIMSG